MMKTHPQFGQTGEKHTAHAETNPAQRRSQQKVAYKAVMLGQEDRTNAKACNNAKDLHLTVPQVPLYQAKWRKTISTCIHQAKHRRVRTPTSAVSIPPLRLLRMTQISSAGTPKCIPDY